MLKVSRDNMSERFHSRFGRALIGLMMCLAMSVSAQADDVKCDTSKSSIDAELNHTDHTQVSDKQMTLSASLAMKVHHKRCDTNVSARQSSDRLVQGANKAEDRLTAMENLERRKTGDVDAAFPDEVEADDTWIEWRWEGKDE